MASEAPQREEPKEPTRLERSGAGMALGVAVFLVGVGLLLVTFWLAYQLFNVPPSQAVVVTDKGALDAARSGQALATIVVRVILLIVMGIVGSLIANRGVHLFTGSRTKRF